MKKAACPLDTDPTIRPNQKLDFDYVIVGAGPSSMGLLMGLLEPYRDSKNTKKSPVSIAIVERGPQVASAADGTTRSSLSRWFEASHDRSSPHVTLLQTSSASSSSTTSLLDVPIGRGVGGGSNINAGLCVAPPPEDFQNWPEPWKTRLPESLLHLQETLASNHCLWNAANGKEMTHKNQQESNEEGESKKNSMYFQDHHVVPCLARYNPNNQQVERVNYYQGLVEPLLLQPSSRLTEQIHWFCNREAQRLLLKDNKVTGVEIMDPVNETYTTLCARKEVILCLGALETPALLLVSGIGPEHNEGNGSAKGKHYQNRSAVVAGVGQNLRDHVILPRVLLSPPPAGLRQCFNGIHRMTPFAIQHEKFLLLTSTTVPEIALHFFTRILQWYWGVLVAAILPKWLANLGWHVLERLVQLVVLYSPVYWILKYAFTTLNLAHVNPRSTGSLCLRPKQLQQHKHDAPSAAGRHNKTIFRRQYFDIQIDPAYVRDPQDIEALWHGWVANPVICSETFASRLEIYPGRVFRYLYGRFSHRRNTRKVSVSAPWFSQFARDASLPFYHWCGTCAMNTISSDDNRGKAWVVDAQLQVRSIESLRICDASVFPNNLSVPPALVCAAAGHLLGGTMLMDVSNSSAS